MIKCQKCGKSSSKKFSIITVGRKTYYKNVIEYNKYEKVIHSNGWEIAKEIIVCQRCFYKYRNLPINMSSNKSITLKTKGKTKGSKK